MTRKGSGTKKIITTFSLDESLVHEFDEICRSEQRSRSNMANKLFRDFMKGK